jgi:hypothetical protein
VLFAGAGDLQALFVDAIAQAPSDGGLWGAKTRSCPSVRAPRAVRRRCGDSRQQDALESPKSPSQQCGLLQADVLSILPVAQS